MESAGESVVCQLVSRGGRYGLLSGGEFDFGKGPFRPQCIGGLTQRRVPQLATLIHVANLAVLEQAAKHLAGGFAIASKLVDDAGEHFFFRRSQMSHSLQQAGSIIDDGAGLRSWRRPSCERRDVRAA